MRYFEIDGPVPLSGTVDIPGAKNNVLALLPAAILTDEPVMLQQIPTISDVDVILSIFDDLHVSWERNDEQITIAADKIAEHCTIEKENASAYRASYYFIGALLSRTGRVRIGLPGGDDFGSRPIDQHMKGFEALGAHVRIEGGYYVIEADSLTGATIYFDVITSGATMNVLLAAVKAKGTTWLRNAARDPEIVGLANMLNQMGARITGAGTDTIRIEGVEHLHGCKHGAIPDRLVAGTFLVAGAATGGEVTVRNVIPAHLDSFLGKLKEIGARIEVNADEITVRSESVYHATQIKTGMYPQFATDLQQPITALLLRSDGKSLITDTVFPKRFRHISELKNMGAKVLHRNGTAYIQGGHPLTGGDVTAYDLRGGMLFMIAACMAEGTSRIFGVEHIERGYAEIIPTFQQLGASIRLIEDEEFEGLDDSFIQTR
ncbi:UDP-N-acetylglucosamine 1-carboxyvinyltransferase [Rubeoparvulum massiliense]|uniref:UDP-N-acetylglucosamine 1-carboxyvinyltransferase n=1 Tax=Rubeoparvulum massiliense TaxID=1631346 RepID=UPI00065E3EC1|nr:UDP-N-acetylglucosamine 1-carboxyvinyltransferase [Rubeoparvulum massiliense]